LIEESLLFVGSQSPLTQSEQKSETEWHFRNASFFARDAISSSMHFFFTECSWISDSSSGALLIGILFKFKTIIIDNPDPIHAMHQSISEHQQEEEKKQRKKQVGGKTVVVVRAS
jgi:hypothetical protein